MILYGLGANMKVELEGSLRKGSVEGGVCEWLRAKEV
jgi:hypothetical protein